MNDLNIHNRHPNDLPDIETIDDILLELKDTNHFDIELIDISIDPHVNSWEAHSRKFIEWLERGDVLVTEMVSKTRPLLEEEDIFTPRYFETITKRYEIFRHPVRLHVKFNDDFKNKYWKIPMELQQEFKISGSRFGGTKEELEMVSIFKDVYLRIKDYLTHDVIQDQFVTSKFTIDFMMSDVKFLGFL